MPLARTTFDAYFSPTPFGPGFLSTSLPSSPVTTTSTPPAATYPTEVIEHYQQFIARRRPGRPIEEYREPTANELTEFGEHFGRRRVELGDCVRPYGTGCTHEHACIRCSFLQIEPGQADRLASIQADINERIAAARDNGWLGDVEQLQLTLGHITDKQAKIRHLLDTLHTAPLITAAPTQTTTI